MALSPNTGVSGALAERVARLERENRRIKLAALTSTSLLFAWTACSLAPEPENVVSAERFVLLGADGTEHAALELDDAGNPLLLLEKDGASAFLTMNGPALVLRGADGKTSAYLGIDSRNASELELTSERIVDGVRLSARPDGSSGVYVLDPTGRERAGLEALSTGGSSLFFRDPNGRPRAQLGIDAGNLPSLVLLDEGSARRIGMVVQQDGNALLEMQDADARARAQLWTAFDGSPQLELMREDGGTSFRAP